MYVLVEVFRTPLYAGHGPEWSILLRATAEAVIVLVLGWRVFRRYEGHFADYV
jgi:ABC-type polysaccharide/polyol phosphate export permease